MDKLLDGWMIGDLMSFSTFNSTALGTAKTPWHFGHSECNGAKVYQDDGWIIMEGCVEWNPIYS